ncbi:helix-turn-helix domain-containing protein [Kitasatospora sp. NPDC006786]|uniref:helix-turn-helix domain-containing protein n=1 Tax=unclassified Kitasatospora TaxID=2633591 RepID=UPI003408A793
MHRVVALVRPVQSTFELGCAAEVFGTLRPGLPQHYTFATCTQVPGPVPTTGGYTMSVPHGLDALDTADTVIVPGWLPVDEPLTDPVRRALLRAHARGARLAAICSGVFALARTGLLDGRTATTHRARADQLRRAYPRIRVEPHRRYVDHGDVATSAGAGAGLDLCLHLVRRDHGAAHAAALARHMAMAPHPDDDRTPCAPQPVSPSLLPPAPPVPVPVPSGQALDGLLAWADERLGAPLSVEALAARLGVSPRTLARRFADQLGTSPGAWLLARRLAAARVLLEDTDLPVDAIAARVGLTSAVNLRRRFRARTGTTPGAYRQAFRTR